MEKAETLSFETAEILSFETKDSYAYEQTRADIVRGLLSELKPRLVADFGTGLGCYGKVCRELGVPCIGIEIWPQFVKSSLPYYDFMVQGDMRSFVERVYGGVFIFGNCLEHMKKKDGLKIARVASLRSEYTIISTPYGYVPYAGTAGKPFSPHVCGYVPSDFCDLDVQKIIYINNLSTKKKVQFMVLIKGKHEGK